jgi:ribonuclease HII
LPKKYKNNNINDSKQLSKKKRNELFEVIIHDAIDYSIAFVSASDVDKLNPKQASIKAMEQALKKMKIVPNICLIDAERINTQIKQENIIKGDCLSISIAAASILAKVARDKYMEKLHINFPQYNFSSNMGYGTNEH